MGYKWIVCSSLAVGVGAAITIYLWRRKHKQKNTSFADIIEYRVPSKTTHKPGNIDKDTDQKRKIRKLSTRTRNALRQNSSGSMKISTPGILPIIQDEDIILSENEFIEDHAISTTIQTNGHTHDDDDEHLKSFISCCNVFIGYIDIQSYYDVTKTCIETKTETDNFRESTLNDDDNDGGVKETKQLYEIQTESANREGENTKLVRVSSIQNKSYEIMRRRRRYLWGGACHYGNKDSSYKIDTINILNNKLAKDTSKSRKTGGMTNSTNNKMVEHSKTQELIAMWQARFRRTSESLSRSQSTRANEKHVNNNSKKSPKENQSIHLENSMRKTSESRREQLRSSNALMTSFDLDDSDLEEGFSSDCSVFISNSEKEALVCDYDVIYRRNSVQERLWEIRQRRRPKRQTRACSWNMA